MSTIKTKIPLNNINMLSKEDFDNVNFDEHPNELFYTLDETDVIYSDVDAQLSDISENPVQNKVITKALNEKVSNEDISLDANAFAESERQKSKNLWAYGDVSGTRWKDTYLTQPLPAGTYTFSAVATNTDTSSNYALVEFYDVNGKYIKGVNILKNERASFIVTISRDCYKISCVGTPTATVGVTFTFTNIMITTDGSTDYQPYNGAIVHEKEAERYDVVYDSTTKQTPLGGTIAYTIGLYGTVEMDLSKYRFIRVYYGHNNKQYTMIINCDVGKNGSCFQLAADTNILATLVSCTKTSFTLVKCGYYVVPTMTFTDRTNEVGGYYGVYRIEGVY
jgi:hypothetical protein